MMSPPFPPVVSSYLDVWFAPGTIRRISAWEVKLAAHALTAELVSETEAELSSSAGGSRGEGPRGRGTRSEEAGDSAGFSERSGTDVDGTEGEARVTGASRADDDDKLYDFSVHGT